MKKKLIISLIVVILALVSYKIIGSVIVSKKTSEFLEAKGYVESDIKKIKVNHSFINGILSYGEWSVLVEFINEPNINFGFAYKNKMIIFKGVHNNQKSKEELMGLEDKFNSGLLHK